MHIMSMIVVKAAFDVDAEVWFVQASDVPGLNVEAATLEAFQAKIPLAIQDLLEEGGIGGAFDIPIEIIAHASTRVRSPVAA